MSNIETIQLIPKQIAFAGGVACDLDPNLKLEDLKQTIKDILGHLTIQTTAPIGVIYELPTNTTGNLVTGLLSLLSPLADPTVAIQTHAILAIDLVGGDSIHPRLGDEPGRSVIDTGLALHNVDFSINKETGNYCLVSDSEKFKGITLSVCISNANHRSPV